MYSIWWVPIPTYFAMAKLALEAKQRSYLLRSIVWIPLYWVLISLAGWWAIAQLFHKPFYWEKTQHGLADKSSQKIG